MALLLWTCWVLSDRGFGNGTVGQYQGAGRSPSRLSQAAERTCLSVNTGVSDELHSSAIAASADGTYGSSGEDNTENKGWIRLSLSPAPFDVVLVNSPNLQCLSFQNTVITRLHPHKCNVYLNNHFQFLKKQKNVL